MESKPSPPQSLTWMPRGNKVPLGLTLSKQTRWILPHRLIRGGLTQKMPCFFSRFWA